VICAVVFMLCGLFTMNILVALSAGYQGLPAACGHPFDPEGALLLSWFIQVCEFTNMVDFAVVR
jgi:hypothetical protein